jgi:nicotinate-nucleotide pyrophosphorylase (carboxylating)
VDLNALALSDLFQYCLDTGFVRRLIDLARDEDLGRGPALPVAGNRNHRRRQTTGLDLTTAACFPAETRGKARVVARQPGVISGQELIAPVLDAFAPGTNVTFHPLDGVRVEAGTLLAELDGWMDEILAAERTLLNLIGRMSGVATKTAEFISAMTAAGPVRAKLFDTRKTTPGMRVLEKYAVRCGGGMCHRIGLHDAVLIKDNHIAGVRTDQLADFVTRAASRARQLGSPAFVEVEVDSESQLAALLTLPRGVVNVALLDNMTPERLAGCVRMRDHAAADLLLEASGGITMKSIRATADTGVERISTGAITHSAIWLDIAMDIEG